MLGLQPFVMNWDPQCHSSCGAGVQDGQGILLTTVEAELGQTGLYGFGGVEEGRSPSSAPVDITAAWESAGCGLLRKVVGGVSQGRFPTTSALAYLCRAC